MEQSYAPLFSWLFVSVALTMVMKINDEGMRRSVCG